MTPNLSQFLEEVLEEIGIDTHQSAAALRETLIEAIAYLGGDVVSVSQERVWRAELRSPVKLVFRGRSPEEALGWCLLYLRAPEYRPTDEFGE